MQESPIHAEVEYASVGWRAAALLVDMVVLFGLLIIVVLVWVTVLVAQGRVDPSDPTAAQALAQELTWTSGWAPNAVLWCALFIYYALLEGIFGASVGKLVFRMRVVMPDGSRATGLAVVVRNLVRIPEAWMLYIPAAVSCTMSAQRQRLGDHAARTVVVRQVTDGAIARRPVRRSPGRGTAAPPHPPAPAASGRRARATQAGAQAVGGAVGDGQPAPAGDLGTALTALKTAALAVRGAHSTYLHFSERELAAHDGHTTGGYSEEYVSAWFTLADAVTSLRRAHAFATDVAAAAGESLAGACSAQPDLTFVLHGLGPYVEAGTDEQVHEAFLAVARSEIRTP